MYKKVKVLEKDNKLKVKEITDYTYAKDLTSSIITIDEVYEACKSLSIFFQINEKNKNLVAILGAKYNNFVNKEGKWEKNIYIPAYIRRYPFIFIEKDNNLILAYDEESKAVNTKEGKTLFNDNEPTQFTQKILDFMKEYQISYTKTQKLIEEIEKLDILEDVVLTINNNKLTGIKKVNEDKLNNLEDNKLLEITKNGIYKFIIAHLISLSNINKLKG